MSGMLFSVFRVKFTQSAFLKFRRFLVLCITPSIKDAPRRPNPSGSRPRCDSSHVARRPSGRIGPALRILQLNVEGLSAAKRSIISTIADQHNIDVICLQETLMLTLMWQIVILFMATTLSASTYMANMDAPSTSEKAWLMFPMKIQQLTATSLRLELSPLPMSTVLPANRGHQITCYLLFLIQLFTWVTLTVSTRIGATPAPTKRARCC